MLLLGITLVLLVWGTAQSALPSDFFLDIDGISVDLSAKFFCALMEAPNQQIGGHVKCFGAYDKVSIPPPKELFVQVSTSARGACGITLEQRVKCWGSPSHMVYDDVEGLFTQISGGDGLICGLKINGGISCFYGKRKAFQIGNLEGDNYVQVSCGFSYCCALDNEGIVHCRGDVTFGYSLKQNNLHQNPEVIMQVGADGELTIAPPEAIPSNKDTEEYEDFIANPSYEAHAMKFKQIAVGHGFICGIQYIDEDIFCWGNDDKELLVTTMKGPFRMVSVSDDQVCGILSGSNKLKCLHENALTQMENVEWDQIKVGNIGRICGVTMSSELKCVHPSATDDELKDFIVA